MFASRNTTKDSLAQSTTSNVSKKSWAHKFPSLRRRSTPQTLSDKAISAAQTAHRLSTETAANDEVIDNLLSLSYLWLADVDSATLRWADYTPTSDEVTSTWLQMMHTKGGVLSHEKARSLVHSVRIDEGYEIPLPPPSVPRPNTPTSRLTLQSNEERDAAFESFKTSFARVFKQKTNVGNTNRGDSRNLGDHVEYLWGAIRDARDSLIQPHKMDRLMPPQLIHHILCTLANTQSDEENRTQQKMTRYARMIQESAYRVLGLEKYMGPPPPYNLDLHSGLP